jgi:hypothetical protein
MNELPAPMIWIEFCEAPDCGFDPELHATIAVPRRNAAVRQKKSRRRE